MRELSVVGPAPTPSSVSTHCLSGSCDQHSGHKEAGTLLNSPGQGLSGQYLQRSVLIMKETQVTVTHCTHVNCSVH